MYSRNRKGRRRHRSLRTMTTSKSLAIVVLGTGEFIFAPHQDTTLARVSACEIFLRQSIRVVGRCSRSGRLLVLRGPRTGLKGWSLSQSGLADCAGAAQ